MESPNRISRASQWTRPELLSPLTLIFSTYRRVDDVPSLSTTCPLQESIFYCPDDSAYCILSLSQDRPMLRIIVADSSNNDDGVCALG